MSSIKFPEIQKRGTTLTLERLELIRSSVKPEGTSETNEGNEQSFHRLGTKLREEDPLSTWTPMTDTVDERTLSVVRTLQSGPNYLQSCRPTETGLLATPRRRKVGTLLLRNCRPHEQRTQETGERKGGRYFYVFGVDNVSGLN